MGVIAKQSIRGTIVTYLGIAVGVVTTFFVLTRFLTTEEIGLARVLIDAAMLFIGLAQLGEKQRRGSWFLLLGAGRSVCRFCSFRHPLLGMSCSVGRMVRR